MRDVSLPDQIIEGEAGTIVFADILKFSNKPLTTVIRRTTTKDKEEITNNQNNLIDSQIHLFLGFVFFLRNVEVLFS